MNDIDHTRPGRGCLVQKQRVYGEHLTRLEYDNSYVASLFCV